MNFIWYEHILNRIHIAKIINVLPVNSNIHVYCMYKSC